MNKDNIKEEFLTVIINDTTKNYMKSNKTTDLIQCALEYNNYLIKNLIKEKNNINNNEYEAALNKLFNNLKILSKHCDKFKEKYLFTDFELDKNQIDDINIYKRAKKKISVESNNNIDTKKFNNSYTGLTFEFDKNLI
jgi:hypothetical protein